ncbi:MAG: cyclic nucleotide-binding domain-containing protein [Polyangiaceae bacterium]
MASSYSMPRALLRTINPFRHLTPTEIDALIPDLTRHEYREGDIVYEQDANDQRVFLLAEGRVEVRDTHRTPPSVVDIITPGHYFGDRPSLFDEPRRFEVRALESVVAYSMDGSRFLALIQGSPTFARAIADLLRSKQKILVAFDQFLAQLTMAAGVGEIRFGSLLRTYRNLEPALHPALASNEIDFGALLYAVRRLPENATRTFVFFLTDTLPQVWDAPGKAFHEVASGVRPRGVYEVMPGKSMVLMRDGTSDLVDFVTCLCVLAIEARKIRKRFRDPEMFLALAEWVARRETTRPTINKLEDPPPELPLTVDELKQLERIWPDDTLTRIRDLAVHHEDWSIEVSRARDTYNSRYSERWAAQLAEATRSLLGCDPAELPAGLQVHIISSNTHSVTNCLSPWLRAHGEEILEWGRATHHRMLDVPWVNETDAVYAIARDYFRAHPERGVERTHADNEAGMIRLRETAFTGIQVELIDTARLMGREVDVDIPKPSHASLIVNIDFAFGQQAGEILGALLTLFGRNLASVNVLGKAGALQGKRGDLLVPTAFLEQSRDLLDPMPPLAVDLERLITRVKGRGVHVGPMLTVAGTLLQNRMMLQFYKQIWRCVGLEMEGAFYFRRTHEAEQLGVIPKNVAQRYLYYVSDLPLDHASNLTESLSPAEGIPPLYAITREILSGVLDTPVASVQLSPRSSRAGHHDGG